MSPKGKVFRIRDRVFSAWAKWAPLKRRLRLSKKRIIDWMNAKRLRHYFDNMLELCHQIVGRRIHTVRQLRLKIHDRKLLVCVYAMLDMRGPMMMLDCWRKWVVHRRNRSRWKATMRKYRCSWYAHSRKSKYICL